MRSPSERLLEAPPARETREIPPRTRADRCPGVLRPWPADDGGLARIRIPGGRVSTDALAALSHIAAAHGDRRVRVTVRANLQLRALPLVDGRLPDDVVRAIEATGLLPSAEHDRARNVLMSPQTGLAGGRADLRPVLAELDRLIRADPRLAALPGRFQFAIDDGRGDLAGLHRDLGLVALDDTRGQLRAGDHWGPEVPLAEAPQRLVDLARAFLAERGRGPAAAWHVTELPAPLLTPAEAGPGAHARSAPLPYGEVPGGTHEQIGDDGIAPEQLRRWTTHPEVIVTPWRGVLVPGLEATP